MDVTVWEKYKNDFFHSGKCIIIGYDHIEYKQTQVKWGYKECYKCYWIEKEKYILIDLENREYEILWNQ